MTARRVRWEGHVAFITRPLRRGAGRSLEPAVGLADPPLPVAPRAPTPPRRPPGSAGQRAMGRNASGVPIARLDASGPGRTA